MEAYASKPIIFLLITIVGFIQFLFILRFLFEVTRVSYNNPVAQFVVKATNPALLLFRIIPLYIGRFDLTIIILITALTILKIYIAQGFISLGYIVIVDDIDIFVKYSLSGNFIAGLAWVIKEVLNILWYAVIIGVIGSWLTAYNSHPLFSLIDEICDPLYKPIRNILPSTPGIDLSPIILLVILNLLYLIILPAISDLARYV